jgi:Family of unknown function (DUF6288)
MARARFIDGDQDSPRRGCLIQMKSIASLLTLVATFINLPAPAADNSGLPSKEDLAKLSPSPVSPAAVSPAFASRLTSKSREAALRQVFNPSDIYKSSESESATERGLVESATVRGLDWLNQWKGTRPNLIGLSLLAFLGHGEVPVSPVYGETVRREIAWVMTQGNIYDGRLSMRKDIAGLGTIDHAILTSALAEYYGLTHDGRVAPLITKALGRIVEGQETDGGWSARLARHVGLSNIGGSSDLWATGWMIEALSTADVAGFGTGATRKALQRAQGYVSTLRGSNGEFGLLSAAFPGDGRSTGIGLYALATPSSIGSKHTVFHFRGPLQGYSNGIMAFEFSYFDSMACDVPIDRLGERDASGPILRRWKQALFNDLLKAQSADGSWPVATRGNSMLEVVYTVSPVTLAPAGGIVPAGPDEFRLGQYDLQQKDDDSGRAYRTAISTLILEGCYRNPQGR